MSELAAITAAAIVFAISAFVSWVTWSDLATYDPNLWDTRNWRIWFLVSSPIAFLSGLFLVVRLVRLFWSVSPAAVLGLFA